MTGKKAVNGWKEGLCCLATQGCEGVKDRELFEHVCSSRSSLCRHCLDGKPLTNEDARVDIVEYARTQIALMERMIPAISAFGMEQRILASMIVDKTDVYVGVLKKMGLLTPDMHGTYEDLRRVYEAEGLAEPAEAR